MPPTPTPVPTPPADQASLALLPETAPRCVNSRLLLHALRRMAAGGLHDAHAAQAFIGAFGTGFRRPLLLIRALMAEMARISQRKFLVAPCCCGRMTRAEGVLLALVAQGERNPHEAHERLAALLGVRQCLGALSSAQALGQAFADLGRPLSLE